MKNLGPPKVLLSHVLSFRGFLQKKEQITGGKEKKEQPENTRDKESRKEGGEGEPA